jgi:hypothetical protein
MIIDFKNKIRSIVDSYAKATVKELKAQLRKDGTMASGKTSNSITYTLNNLNVQLNYEDSLDIVSKGIGSGKNVNVNNILSWMKSKNITPRDRPNNVQGRLSTAFAISSSIRKSGTIKRFAYKGSNIMKGSGEGTPLFKKMQSQIKEASILYIDNLINETLKKI